MALCLNQPHKFGNCSFAPHLLRPRYCKFQNNHQKVRKKLSTNSVDNLGYKVTMTLLRQVVIGSGHFYATVTGSNQIYINQWLINLI